MLGTPPPKNYGTKFSTVSRAQNLLLYKRNRIRFLLALGSVGRPVGLFFRFRRITENVHVFSLQNTRFTGLCSVALRFRLEFAQVCPRRPRVLVPGRNELIRRNRARRLRAMAPGARYGQDHT